jgi:hypothetical protein
MRASWLGTPEKDRSALNKLVAKHGINTAEFRGP